MAAKSQVALPSWRDKDDTNVFTIGGRRVQIVKKGRAQAEQIYAVNRWLHDNLSETLKASSGDNQSVQLGLSAMLALAGNLSVDAQMQLARAILGKTDEDGREITDAFIDENYDMRWMVDGLEMITKVSQLQNLFTAFFTSSG